MDKCKWCGDPVADGIDFCSEDCRIVALADATTDKPEDIKLCDNCGEPAESTLCDSCLDKDEPDGGDVQEREE